MAGKLGAERGVQRGGHREPEEKRDRAVGEATEKPLRRAGRNECPMSDQVLKQPLPLEKDGTGEKGHKKQRKSNDRDRTPMGQDPMY